jgi:hypothetical protein
MSGVRIYGYQEETSGIAELRENFLPFVESE